MLSAVVHAWCEILGCAVKKVGRLIAGKLWIMVTVDYMQDFSIQGLKKLCHIYSCAKKSVWLS